MRTVHRTSSVTKSRTSVETFHAQIGRRHYRCAFPPRQVQRRITNQCEADHIVAWVLKLCLQTRNGVLPYQEGMEEIRLTFHLEPHISNVDLHPPFCFCGWAAFPWAKNKIENEYENKVKKWHMERFLAKSENSTAAGCSGEIHWSRQPDAVDTWRLEDDITLWHSWGQFPREILWTDRCLWGEAPLQS